MGEDMKRIHLTAQICIRIGEHFCTLFPFNTAEPCDPDRLLHATAVGEENEIARIRRHAVVFRPGDHPVREIYGGVGAFHSGEERHVSLADARVRRQRIGRGACIVRVGIGDRENTDPGR